MDVNIQESCNFRSQFDPLNINLAFFRKYFFYFFVGKYINLAFFRKYFFYFFVGKYILNEKSFE